MHQIRAHGYAVGGRKLAEHKRQDVTLRALGVYPHRVGVAQLRSQVRPGGRGMLLLLQFPRAWNRGRRPRRVLMLVSGNVATSESLPFLRHPR